MPLLLYKILCLPLRLSSFFRFAYPYCYVSRNSTDKKDKYELCWYFNNNGVEQGKIGYHKNGKLHYYNYSSKKYVGHILSLKLNYRQMYRWWRKG